MSVAVRLPQELRSFLDLPGPQTLLIRGPPGSGKTTLSLALLEAFKGDRFLVTSRVPNRELNREFPWLGNNGGRDIQLVDTSEMDESVHDIARVFRQARRYLLAAPDPEEAELAKFLWLPTPLQDTWSRLDPEKPSLVIIDSWDALVEQFLGSEGMTEEAERLPGRPEIERLLLRKMRRTPAHVVFVLEREDQTALDYLVNGVVLTQRHTVDERLERWMSLLKLRGVRIENPSYPFTLEKARFESILPVQPYTSIPVGHMEPEPDHVPNYIWPGSRSFAEAFGRLPLGRTTVISLDDPVSSQVANVFLFPIIAHILSVGGKVLMVPPSTLTPRDIYQSLSGTVSRERFVANVRLMIPPGPVPKEAEDLWKTVISLQKPEPNAPPQDPMESEGIRFLRRGISPSNPGLLVLSVEGLQAILAAMGISLPPGTAQRMPETFQSVLRDAPIHSIVLGRKDSELLEPLREIAALRLRVGVRQGRIFIYGINPWTPSFVLTESANGSAYGLLRIV